MLLLLQQILDTSRRKACEDLINQNRRIAGFLKLDQCKSFNWTNYTTLAWTNQLRSNKCPIVLIFDHMARKHIPWDVQKGCGGENGACVRTMSESDGGDALHCEAPHNSADPIICGILSYHRT